MRLLRLFQQRWRAIAWIGFTALASGWLGAIEWMSNPPLHWPADPMAWWNGENDCSDPDLATHRGIQGLAEIEPLEGDAVFEVGTGGRNCRTEKWSQGFRVPLNGSDGRGFRPEKTSHSRFDPLTLREQAVELGGTMNSPSASEHRTVVRLPFITRTRSPKAIQQSSYRHAVPPRLI